MRVFLGTLLLLAFGIPALAQEAQEPQEEDPCRVVFDEDVPALGIEPTPRAPFPIRKGLYLNADDFHLSAGRVTAKGNVTFVGEGLSACADEAELNLDTAVLTLSSGVRARLDAQGTVIRILANKAAINTVTQTGELYGVAVLSEGLRFSAGRLVRQADETIIAEEIYLTPCLCGPGAIPSWDVAASEMRLRKSGRASFVHGRLRIKGVPVFFAPFGLIPLTTSRISGMLSPELLRPGNDDYEIRLPFFFAPARWWDFTVTPIWNGERGLKVDTSARYVARPGTGALGLTVGQDDKVVADAASLFADPDLAEQRYGGLRWFLRGALDQEPVADLHVRANLAFASDDRWAFDFGTSTTERMRQDFESNILIHKATRFFSITGASTYFQDQRIAVLPSTGANRFDPRPNGTIPSQPFEAAKTVSLPARILVSGPLVPLLQRPVGLAIGADLAYEVAANIDTPRTGFAFGNLRFPDDNPLAVPPRQAHRLTFQPLVAVPVSFFGGGLSSLTQFGARTEAAQASGGGTAARVLPLVTSDLRMEVGRSFERPGTGVRYRHAIIPEVTAQYVPRSFFDGDENTASVFGAGAPEEGLVANVAITNLLLSRRLRRNGRWSNTSQLLAVSVGQQYRYADATETGQLELIRGAPFASLRTGYSLFSLLATASLTEDATSLDRASVFLGAGSARGPWSLAGTYSFKAPDTDSLSLSASLIPGLAYPLGGTLGAALSRLSLTGGVSFDLTQSRFTDQLISVGGGFSYTSPCQCWSIAFTIGKDTDREEPNFSFHFTPTVPRSTKRSRALVTSDDP